MFKGHISISKFSSNTEPRNGYSITIEDDSSGVRMIRVILTYEQFAEAINGYSDCEFKLGDVSLVGKTREHKVEFIDASDIDVWKIKDYQIREILSAYEVDGWLGSDYDFKNHHNHNPKDKTIKVSFVRYVEK